MTPPTLVLTAGLGTRLDPLTRVIAKPAVPLGDRTLIERVLAWLGHEGAHDVVLNLHHRPASITAVVGDGAHLGLSVRYSWEQPLLGSAGGPRHALPLLDNDTIVIVNGDTLCSLDLTEMLAAHAASDADVTLAVVPNAHPDHYNGIAIDSGDRVTDFLARGVTTKNWHFVGVQIARTSVFAGLSDGVSSETVSGIYKDLLVAKPGAIRVWKTDQPFLDVGTPRDYLRAAQSHGAGRTIVWPGATVADDADLDACVVIGDVRIPRGFRAESAVLAPRSLVRPAESVEIRDGVAVFALD